LYVKEGDLEIRFFMLYVGIVVGREKVSILELECCYVYNKLLFNMF